MDGWMDVCMYIHTSLEKFFKLKTISTIGRFPKGAFFPKRL